MAAPTTYTAYVAALAAVSVSGRTRAYTEPPGSVNTADLPATYPRLPFGIDGPLTASGGGGWPTLTGQIVYLIEPVAQNTGSANFTATLAAMDNFITGIEALDTSKSKLSWEIRAEIVPLGDHDYWALIAEITGHG